MKIAIATFEFEGYTKNGGIGTAYRRLADALVEDGHDVKVFLFPFLSALPDISKAMKNPDRSIKSEVFVVPEESPYTKSNPWFVSRSMIMYQILSKHSFDVVHFPDSCGMGYYSLLAKRLKLDFANTTFVIGAHGPNYWVREVNLESPRDPYDASAMIFERKSVEFADIVISPSQYMIDYLRDAGWKFPKDSRVIPNINRLNSLSTKMQIRKRDGWTHGIIFFGRFEIRKGILLFLEGLKKFLIENPAIGSDKKFPVIFLGKDFLIGRDKMASEVIQDELLPFGDRIKIVFKTDLDSKASMGYINRNRNYLVCMPSLVDNSPYVVVEAMELAVNFFSSGCGGQSELIHQDDQEHFLFAPTPGALAARIKQRILSDVSPCRPSPEAINANRAWSLFHKDLEKKAKKKARPATGGHPTRKPLVSVCLSLSNQQDSVDAILASIEKQKYPNIEVLFVGAERKGALNLGPRFKSKCRGTVKSIPGVVEAAAGKYVLFLDGVKLTSDNAVDIFVKSAIEGSADLLNCIVALRSTPISDERQVELDSESEFVILSATGFLNELFTNKYRHSVAFGKTVTFLQICRSRKEKSSDDLDLWSLLAKAAALNKNLVCIPIPLVEGPTQVLDEKTAHQYHRKALRHYENHLPDNFRDLPLLLAGLFHQVKGLQNSIWNEKRYLMEIFKHGLQNEFVDLIRDGQLPID